MLKRQHSLFSIFLLLTAILAACLSSGAAQAAESLKIIVPGFRDARTGPVIPEAGVADAAERLADNLARTGHFVPVNFTAENLDDLWGEKETQIDYEAWKKSDADFLLIGRLSSNDQGTILEMRLFDLKNEKLALEKRYEGAHLDLSFWMNDFANKLMTLAGAGPGVFGTEIVFVGGERSQKKIMMVNFGQETAKTLFEHRGGPSTQPAVGPQGQVAWVRRQGKIWELVQDGRVISSGDLHLSPAFQVDGTLVAAVSGQDSTNIFSFIEGKRQPITTLAQGFAVSPTFSPNGRQMAYVLGSEDGNAKIYVMNLAGGPAKPLETSFKLNTDPVWSPDGRHIVFVGDETDICVIQPDGAGFKQLTKDQGVNRRPVYSPDGRLILFASDRQNGKFQLFTMTAAGDIQKVLVPNEVQPQSQPFWAPAGIKSTDKSS